MAEKIEGDGFPSCLDEEVGGGEVLPEVAATEPGLAERALAAWDDGVELAKGAVRDAQRALDLEGNIERLGPGDSLELKVSAGARAGIQVAAGELLEVKRQADGKYVVAGGGELGVSYGSKVAVGFEALQELGVEQNGAARVELACDTAAEAAAAARALRNLQLRGLGVPVGSPREELALIGRKLFAVELGLKTSGQADVSSSVLGAGLELRGAVQAESSARFEFGKGGTQLVVKTAVGGEGGAPLRLGGLLPRTSAALPPAGSLSLGQPLKAAVKVESETRLELKADVKTALAEAKSTLSFSSEARASALFFGRGRDAKVSVETTGAQARAVLEAVALQDAARLAPLLSAEATLEARHFSELGGEAQLGVSAGGAGGYLGLEAKLRDVDTPAAHKLKAPLGELLGWMAGD